MRKMAAILSTVMAGLLLASGASAETVNVSAAASLQEAMGDVAKAYKAQTGDDVVLTLGSSGQLATQIKDGVPADLFISAADKQVDDLIKAGNADAASRRVIAKNTLVLIVPAGETGGPKSFADLADAKVKKIAVGDPKTVPAGDYAMQTLTALKLADKVQDRLVFGTNVRQVLVYVERGEVAAGIVYATDAKESGEKVRVIATADEKDHKPIVYPAVLIKGGVHQAAAAKFLDYFKTEKGQAILAARGFVMEAAKESTAAPAK